MVRKNLLNSIVCSAARRVLLFSLPEGKYSFNNTEENQLKCASGRSRQLQPLRTSSKGYWECRSGAAIAIPATSSSSHTMPCTEPHPTSVKKHKVSGKLPEIGDFIEQVWKSRSGEAVWGHPSSSERWQLKENKHQSSPCMACNGNKAQEGLQAEGKGI